MTRQVRIEPMMTLKLMLNNSGKCRGAELSSAKIYKESLINIY